MAVRMYRRYKTVGDLSQQRALDALSETGLTPEDADGIYHLTSLAKFDDRFVIPASHREQALEMLDYVGDVKGSTGFGTKDSPERGL